MPIECLISFDNNPQGVYYAGQELSGVVDLGVDTTRRIKSIHITVSGYAKTRWIKKGYPRDSERAMCRAYRSYLSSRSYVLGSCASNSFVDWSAGEYSYTFHVILPANLPTSFDGKFGQIHYEIITTIERPGRYPKVFKIPFTVIQPLDLNAEAVYRAPLEIFSRKRFWSFCCPTGPLTVKFSTPYCGYAPGQKIHFVMYINNESSIDITACVVKLKQEVTYESHDPQHEYRYDKNLIACKQFANVLRWSRKVYRGYLELLSIPPTSLKISCPISVTYYIKLIVRPTEFHWQMKLKIPITVGTMPILDNAAAINEALRRVNRQLRGSHQEDNDDHHDGDENGNGYMNTVQHPNLQRTLARRLHQREQEDAAGTATTTANTTATTTPIVTVTDGDNPPDYIPMMPPSYEDAMALSEKFYDDTEFSQNVSMSSIVPQPATAKGDGTDTGRGGEPYKPRYPVYYDYETPTIPPETLYDESPSQLRIALHIATHSDSGADMSPTLSMLTPLSTPPPPQPPSSFQQPHHHHHHHLSPMLTPQQQHGQLQGFLQSPLTDTVQYGLLRKSKK